MHWIVGWKSPLLWYKGIICVRLVIAVFQRTSNNVLYHSSCLQILQSMDELTIRHRTLYVGFNLRWPVNRLWCILFNRFYRLEIHSLMVGIFDPACELLPPRWKELYLCTVALYLLSDLLPPPSFPKLNVHYIQTVCDSGVGVGGGGVELYIDHILQEFYTLFLTRFRTYTNAHHPKQNDQ